MILHLLLLLSLVISYWSVIIIVILTKVSIVILTIIHCYCVLLSNVIPLLHCYLCVVHVLLSIILLVLFSSLWVSLICECLICGLTNPSRRAGVTIIVHYMHHVHHSLDTTPGMKWPFFRQILQINCLIGFDTSNYLWSHATKSRPHPLEWNATFSSNITS